MINPIDDLTAAILEKFTGIPAVKNAMEYPETLSGISTPALLLEEASFELAEDDGTDRLPLLARYVVSVVVTRINSDAEKVARNLAIEVLRQIHVSQNFGIEGVGFPDIHQAEPDPFEMSNQSGKGQSFEVWTVEWTYKVFLGESIWAEEGDVPTSVYAGIAPKIGAAHKDDYVQISEKPL